jgi:LAGLIDADG endonuclease
MGRAIGGSVAIQARVDAAPGLTPMDAHALAGFIAAEGCFVIRRNNGESDWSCVLQVTQRDDDEHVLEDICRSTGLGRIARRPPQGNSRPLASWTVASKLECRELVRILREAPLRGRKQREFEVWADAVDVWAERLYDPRRSPQIDMRLAALAAELVRLRRYVNPLPPKIDATEPASDELLWFLGGFFSGEGSFTLSPSTARATIRLRADDRPLLDTFAAALGLGKVYEYGPESSSGPVAAWVVCGQGELERLVVFFNRAVLRGRKRREFDAWRHGAEEFMAARRSRRKREQGRLDEAIASLRDARKYVAREPSRPVDSGSRHRNARRVYANLLRDWAGFTEGPLSYTAYAEARNEHPEWPQRNTIAAALGGWAAAVRSAGLGDRLTARSQTRLKRAGSARTPPASRTSAPRPARA